MGYQVPRDLGDESIGSSSCGVRSAMRTRDSLRQIYQGKDVVIVQNGEFGPGTHVGECTATWRRRRCCSKWSVIRAGMLQDEPPTSEESATGGHTCGRKDISVRG